MQYTPQGFGRALQRTVKAVEDRESKAVAERAKITKDGILSVAAGVGAIGGVKPGWVQYKVEGSGGNAYALVRLKGGFALLTERGSYKHAGGWEIVPKQQRKATRAARTRVLGRGVAGPIASADIGGGGGVLASESKGFGPVARAEHPALGARPFFKQGVALSKPASIAAYRASIQASLAEALR